MIDIALLFALLAVDSPAGDECRMADWLTEWITANAADCSVIRLRDCLIVTRGKRPKTAIFAHIDTIGYTAAFDGSVYPIGHPATPTEDYRIRVIGTPQARLGTLKKKKSGAWKHAGLDCIPGDRIVSADPPSYDEAAGTITAPYLDNRGGIYAALQALLQTEQVAVAFTTGEETGGSGAKICARHLWETHAISNALVSDITWHTKHVKCGNGVALSLRDSSMPSQRFVERILKLAEQSGIQYQLEIESSGGSDGQGIEHSGYPIDWIFVGAPEKRPHTPTEELSLSDLDAMSRMLIYLVAALDK